MLLINPANMPDPIRAGSEVLARGRLDDSCTPACFQTRSIWPQNLTVLQTQIGSGLVLHGMIWENAAESETGKLTAGQLCSRPDDSGSPACYQSRFVWAKPGRLDLIRISFVSCDPGLLWKNRTKSDVRSRIQQMYMIRPDSGSTPAITATICRN